jgi:hypothetical protein
MRRRWVSLAHPAAGAAGGARARNGGSDTGGAVWLELYLRSRVCVLLELVPDPGSW